MNSIPDDELYERDIAIVGMAGRFPGARNITEFWHNLQAGRESITFFSEEEALADGADPRLVKHPQYVKAYGVLADIDLFDAGFFGFSPREAQTLDPQQRFFLECAWEALEHAGYDAETYHGHIGMFAGASMSGYLRRILANREIANAVGGTQIILGNDKDYVATRVSYKLNLKGPALTVQTACSTSLVAIHLACQSLLNEECDMCMAGGVSIAVPQKAGYIYQEGSTQSPDGHCRAFDAEGRGIVSGSGVAIVVLKRLSDALEDHDTIHAIIKGSALNNDGSLKIGYTAPGIEGQAEVIAEAQAVAGIEPESVTYVETHGTGTPLGDPIEIAALTRAFSARTKKLGFCALGSVKTNIGHLDAAAGATGLIKTVLALEHGQIPASLHFTHPNPKIDFASSPFYVNTHLRTWESGAKPRRAGVSSFGIGGTNAHIVLEEAPQPEPSAPEKPWKLLMLSAKSSSALTTMTANMADYLKEHPNLSLADVAYTSQVGRRTFNHRRFVVCKDTAEAINTLAPQTGQTFTAFQEAEEQAVVFMFPGGGAQYVGMGLELYQHEPTFRAEIDRCSLLLKPHLKRDLRTILYPTEAQDKEQASKLLRQASFALTALFTVEYALAKLWMSWSIQPKAMIGHSLGEYVAACLAGVFTLQEALALVALRGQLLDQLPSGAMLSVPLPGQEVLPLLTFDLSLAAANAPSLSVIAGPVDAIASMAAEFTRQGIEVRLVPIDAASHSSMVEPILEPFRQFISRCSLQSPRLPYISNVSGTWISAQQATDPEYWVTHFRETVRFSEGIQTLLREPGQLLLEVGPGRTLSSLAKQHASHSTSSITTFPSLSTSAERPTEYASLLTTLGQLWLAGASINWQEFSAQQQRQRIPLPAYPFERQRYWIDPQPNAPEQQVKARTMTDLDEPWLYVPSWKRSLPSEASVERTTARHLLFADQNGTGALLAQRLRETGSSVVLVERGAQFSASGDQSYLLNPQCTTDYALLLTTLLANDELPDTLLYLWSLDPVPTRQENDQPDDLSHLSALLSLAQALHELQEPARTLSFEIIIVTNDGQEVTGQENVHAEQTLLAGLCKWITQEYSHITCSTLDISLPTSDTQPSVQLLNVLTATRPTHSPDQLLAYRGRHYWEQTIEQLPLKTRSTAQPTLREGGNYLLIDGPDAPGPVFADYLTHTLNAHVLLVEARTFPARAMWQQWQMTQGPLNPSSRKIQQLQELATTTTDLQLRWVDLTNTEDLRMCIDTFVMQTGTLHGVLALSNLDDGSAAPHEENTLARTESIPVLQNKQRELLALQGALQAHEPDFCIVGSSLASSFGGKDQFLGAMTGLLSDAFVHQHNQDNSSRPWVSAHWDRWQSHLEPASSKDSTDLTAPALLRAFEQLAATTTATNILILSDDLDSRAVSWSRPLSEQVRATEIEPETEPETSLSLRPDQQTTYVAPDNEVEKTIAVLWQELLGVERPGVHDDFFELGGHSLMAAQFITRLREVFMVEIPLQSIFEKPTIAGLAEVAETLFVEKLEQLSDEEAERLISQVFHYGY